MKNILNDIKSKFKANTSKIFEHGGTTIDRFPIINKLGLFYRTPMQWLRVLYDFEWSNKDVYRHHIGIEALSRKNLSLRIGYNYHDETQALTFGAGMDFQFLQKYNAYIDYAFMPSVAIDEGSSHIYELWLLYPWQNHIYQ